MPRPMSARAATLTQLRKRERHRIQGERFAREMSIRAEIARQIVADVVELAIERHDQINEPRRVVSFAVPAEECSGPCPGEGAKRQLERACPVDAPFGRVRTQPVFELRNEDIPVGLDVREPVGAAQRAPVLMPIQLPDHLVIATRRFEIRNRRPEGLWRSRIIDPIVVPVGGRSARDVAIAKEIVTPSRRARWLAWSRLRVRPESARESPARGTPGKRSVAARTTPGR